jgi:predicted nucleic acid-binding Zn ribbon protein
MPSYRRSPRSLAVSLDALADELAPRTVLAEVQRIWTAAVGEELSRQSTATAERGGTLTVSCADAMWAQELDLMSVQVLAELNARLRSGSVRRLRCVAVGHGR